MYKVAKCNICGKYYSYRYRDNCPHCKSYSCTEPSDETIKSEFTMNELADYFGKDEVIDFLNEGY
jgi:uncharacterized OB-fold protein